MSLDELERLHREATPGPWSYDDGITDDSVDPPIRSKPMALQGPRGYGPFGIPMPIGCLCWSEDCEEAAAYDDKDWRFIAAMRNAIPALISVARAAIDLDTAWHTFDGAREREKWHALRDALRQLEGA